MNLDAPFISEVKNCARCGQTHSVAVHPFINRPEVSDFKTGSQVTHYAVCPVTLEPILVIIRLVSEGPESIA